MNKVFVSIIYILLLFFSTECYAQASTVASAIVKQIAKTISKKSVTELSHVGGEAGIKQALEKIALQTGEAGITSTQKYVALYGTGALIAIETAPKTVLDALNIVNPEQQKRIIATSQSNNALAKKIGTYGLILECKYPNFAERISQLGDDNITKIAFGNMSKPEVAILAKNTKPLLAVKNADISQFKKFVDNLKSSTKRTIELLEKNPKVLFTGAGLTAFISAKEELVGENGAIRKPLNFVAWVASIFVCIWFILKLKIHRLFKRRKS